jgi:hypothetical protein
LILKFPLREEDYCNINDTVKAPSLRRLWIEASFDSEELEVSTRPFSFGRFPLLEQFNLPDTFSVDTFVRPIVVASMPLFTAASSSPVWIFRKTSVSTTYIFQ